MRTERELLVDCLERLNRLPVPYMLVGSMASNYWGIPRSTHDLDFVLVLQPADAESLAALRHSAPAFSSKSSQSCEHSRGRTSSTRLMNNRH